MTPQRCPPEDLLRRNPRSFDIALHLERCAACRAVLREPFTSSPEPGWLRRRLPTPLFAKPAPSYPPPEVGTAWTIRRPTDAHWAEPDFAGIVVETAEDDAMVRVMALVPEYAPELTAIEDLDGYAAVPRVLAWMPDLALAHFIGRIDEHVLHALATGEPHDTLHEIAADETQDDWTAADALRLAFVQRLAALVPAFDLDVLRSALETNDRTVIERVAREHDQHVTDRLVASAGEDELNVADASGRILARITMTGQNWRLVEVPSPPFDRRVGRIVDGNANLLGSCWAFDDTTLITAAHVLDGDPVRVATWTGILPCSIVEMWPDLDIAVIRSPGRHGFEVWESRINPGSKPGLDRVLAADAEWGAVRELACTGARVVAGGFEIHGIQKGMSGGPILDKHRDVVGVIVERGHPQGRDLEVLASRMAMKGCKPSATRGQHVFSMASVSPKARILTIVLAPPDFGKTTLLDQLERSHRGPVIRVDANSLDSMDELNATLEHQCNRRGLRAGSLDEHCLVLIDDLHSTGVQPRFMREKKGSIIKNSCVVIATQDPRLSIRGQPGSIPTATWVKRDLSVPLPTPDKYKLAKFVEDLRLQASEALDDLSAALRGKAITDARHRFCLTDDNGALALDDHWTQALTQALDHG